MRSMPEDRTARAVIRDEALRLLVRTNPHSPGMFRAFAPLTNIPAFYEAFHCTEGAMFRPDSERAKIW